MSSLHTNVLALGHAALTVLVGAATTTTAKPTTSSSSALFLPILLLIGVGGYLLFIRPRNQAMRRQQANVQQAGIGDRVLTRAGIVGRVKGFNGDRVLIEVSPGVVLEMVRQGIGQTLPEELDDEDLIPPPPGADELDEDLGDIGDVDVAEHDDGAAPDGWHTAEDAAAADVPESDVEVTALAGPGAEGEPDDTGDGSAEETKGRRGRRSRRCRRDDSAPASS